jgi:hypothetical protein
VLRDGDVTLGMVAHVRADATPGTDSMANVACLGGLSLGVGIGGSFTSCTTVQARILGGTAGPTPGANLTLQQAIVQVPASGQGAAPCAIAPGGTCPVSGAVNGQGVVTASMQWTLTANVPAGVAAGTVPMAVFSTTSGQEGFACSPVVAGVGTVTCAGTTVGNALQGSAVTVVFAPGITAAGTITAAAPGGGLGALGVAGLLPPPALLPPPGLLPPPPALVPPPPVPLLPPPGPGSFQPAAASVGPGMAGGPPVRLYAEVPVIPEADSLPLLVGGLAALGALAALRARRRR